MKDRRKCNVGDDFHPYHLRILSKMTGKVMYMVVSERSAVANRLSYQPVNRLETGCKEAGVTAEAVREYVTAYMASGRSLLETAIDLAQDWRMEVGRARRLVQLAYVGS